MKIAKCLVLLLAFLLVSSAIAFAQEGEIKQESMMSQGMKAGKMKEMMKHGMMMKQMMKKQMVATEDGGVVVLVGNKLLKYDKKLNLVKEAEINIDYESMKRKIKEKCSKYKEMMEEKQEE